MTLLHPIPALTDNYIWALHDGAQAWVVDPGQAEPVLAWLAAQRLQLAGILLTHHHGDHTGGVAALRAATAAPAWGPAGEPLPDGVQRVHGGERVALLGRSFEVIEVPGHTAGHIAWYCAGFAPASIAGPVDSAPGIASASKLASAPAPASAPDLVSVPAAASTPDQAPARGQPLGSEGLLFCGDTLFSIGCGRLFEGSPAQMLASLDRLAALPARQHLGLLHPRIHPRQPALCACARTRAPGLGRPPALVRAPAPSRPPHPAEPHRAGARAQPLSAQPGTRAAPCPPTAGPGVCAGWL